MENSFGSDKGIPKFAGGERKGTTQFTHNPESLYVFETMGEQDLCVNPTLDD